MSGDCYAERRAALRWPLVMWGLGLPLALVAVFVLLGILVNPDWFIAAAFTPVFVPVMMGIGLLCRNWPTGIRIDERGVTIGAVGSRRAAMRRPTVTYQNWGLFSCAWRDINDVQVVTDPVRLHEIKKSAEYWTLSNRWGKPRQMTCCMAGVLTAPFMNAALVIDVGYAGVASPELRSTLFFANWIGAPKFAERLRATPSPVWVVPTRNPDVLRDFLKHNWVAGGLFIWLPGHMSEGLEWPLSLPIQISGPGRQTTVSASGSGCRRSRLLSTGGMLRMRWGGRAHRRGARGRCHRANLRGHGPFPACRGEGAARAR